MKEPETLEEYLEYLSNVKYESYGFPFFWLDYNQFQIIRGWSCAYRNPKNFTNPDTRYDTPLEACKGMYEFILNLKNEKTL